MADPDYLIFSRLHNTDFVSVCACVQVYVFTVTLLQWNGYLITISEHLHTPVCFFPAVADTESGTAVSRFLHSKSTLFVYSFHIVAVACYYMEKNCTFKLVEQKYGKMVKQCSRSL